MPLSDEAVAVRVAELVDGVIRQLLSVWDALEPSALGGSGMSRAAAPGLSTAANGGEFAVVFVEALSCFYIRAPSTVLACPLSFSL